MYFHILFDLTHIFFFKKKTKNYYLNTHTKRDLKSMEMSERHKLQKERRSLKKRSILKGHQPISVKRQVLGSKDLGFYVFRTLICIVGKP